MDTELNDFEQSMRREIDAFLKPGKDPKPQASPTPRRTTSKPPARGDAKAMKTGHIVKLAVRTKPLELDTVFEHHSTSISKLEAQLEAEKAARQAGYPIIGYVIETHRL